MQTVSHSFFYYFVYWAISALAFLITARLLKGFELSGFFSAFFAAIFLGLANTFLWPVLFFLTLPLNLITLGFFTFILNGAVLKLVSAFLPGFQLRGWGPAIFGAILISIFNSLLHFFLMPQLTWLEPAVNSTISI